MAPRRWGLALLFLLTPLHAPALFAAEAEQEATSETPTPAAGNESEDPLLTEAAEAQDQPQQRPAADDTFTPSVQISEDLSVSFPVDI